MIPYDHKPLGMIVSQTANTITNPQSNKLFYRKHQDKKPFLAKKSKSTITMLNDRASYDILAIFLALFICIRRQIR